VTDLLDTLRFRNGITARNRIALAAMTNSQSHADGSLSDDELRWLEVRADGGFGIIATCATHVSRDGQGWAGELGIFDDSLLPDWRRLAASMQQRGALPIAQIFHGGLRARADLIGGRPWSASSDEATGARAATEADIEGIINAFGDAAARAHAAGMAGVEIHGAHGYLFSQFLSVLQNRRDDAWGGSLENRFRLLRMVTRTVRARVPASFIVGVRLSPEDFGNAKGLDLDESLQVARWLGEEGIDFLHASLWDVRRNSIKRPDTHVLPLFRQAISSDIPLFVAGKIWTRADADHAFALGADAIALGRPAIVNPDWPLRIADPDWQPRRPPLTAAEFRALGLNDRFIESLRSRPDFVAP
jgi:2,4-dienoyl-CoA reductase-like NADH-dependent reductase (Old Yellow Enzyme family)